MQAQLKPETLDRLEEQDELLLRLYEAEFVKDSASRATESARSNLIALRHTIHQIYGEFAAIELKASALAPAATAFLDTAFPDKE